MASPLTLIMPVIPGTDPVTIAKTLAQYQPQLDAALKSIGTVHYARTLYLDGSSANLQPSMSSSGPFMICVITEYDGSFDAYIGDFVAQVGTVFDALLQYVVGGPELIPVANNLNGFTAFVAQNDASQHAPNEGLFEAYPQTVQQILAKFPPS
jgi:hypothetical protein